MTDPFEIAQCLPELRYREARPDEVGPMQVLQQAWRVTRYSVTHNTIYSVRNFDSTRVEWRDVPVEQSSGIA
jgi:hypothetical protein